MCIIHSVTPLHLLLFPPYPTSVPASQAKFYDLVSFCDPLNLDRVSVGPDMELSAGAWEPSKGQNTENSGSSLSSWDLFLCHIALLTSRTGLDNSVDNGHWLVLIVGVVLSLTLWVWLCNNPVVG